ncbi:MAG: translation elongation factor Ts [Phycisphaerales bacterium]
MTTTNISSKDVMALRERTGLGMMDCKKALTEANGDMAVAEAALREALKGKMDTRTDRAAGEGCVAVAVAGRKAAIVEVRAETDFTARNPEFRAMAEKVAKIAAAGAAGAVSVSPEMTKLIDEVRIRTGENISFGGGTVLEGDAFGQYIHHDGKKGAIIAYTGTLDADSAVGICQHIVAVTPPPVAVDEAGVPADVVAKRKQEAVDEAKASGKPEQIAVKMAEGKMRKFFEEVTLLGQAYVRDDKKQVKALLPAGTKILSFARLAVGQH